MKPIVIAGLVTAFVIAIIAMAGVLGRLQSVPFEDFERDLDSMVLDDGLRILQTWGSGMTEPLPLFHRLRFPHSGLRKHLGTPDGSLKHRIGNGTGSFEISIQMRRHQVCFVTLTNHSAEEDAVRKFSRSLANQFPGLTVRLKE